MKHFFPLCLLISLLLISCQEKTPTPIATPTLDNGASISTDLANPLSSSTDPNAHPVVDLYGKQLLGITETITVSEEKFNLPGMSDILKPDITASFTRTPWLYIGKWNNGIGYVGLGPDMGNIPIVKAINQDSAAIFFTTITAPEPTTASDAQELVFAQYPHLAEMGVNLLNGEGIFSFYKKIDHIPYKSIDGSMSLNNEIVMYGVNNGKQPGELIVWALLISGKSSEQFR